MILLTFAHRAEAQAFFDEMSFRVVDQKIQGLYHSGDLYLLITKEGMNNAMASLALALGHLVDVREIINLGVAGALREDDKNLSIGQIVPIRTVYRHLGDELSFHSFSSGPHANISLLNLDLVSSDSRVLHQDLKEKLSAFGHLVDREYWALAFVAKKQGIPISSYKIISDHADNSEICSLVKERAPFLSQKLYLFFLDHFHSGLLPKRSEDIPLPENFYFTTAQERIFCKGMKTIAHKYQCSLEEAFSKLHIEKICSEINHPKKRTNHLLSSINQFIAPYSVQVHSQLTEALGPISAPGTKVHWDPSLEKVGFGLQAEIKSEEDLRLLANSLKNISFAQIEAIFEGQGLE